MRCGSRPTSSTCRPRCRRGGAGTRECTLDRRRVGAAARCRLAPRARSPCGRRGASLAREASRRARSRAFDDPLHRRACAHLLGQEGADGELTPLLAELYALADEDDITEQTAEQLLLRLRERKIQRELAALSEADEGRLVDLQQALLKIRTAIREFA